MGMAEGTRRMKFLSGWVVLAATVLWLSGCAITLGARFDSSQIVKIKEGVTTQSQIKEMMGEPASDGMKDGNPLWTYIYARVPLLGGVARGTVVSIEFDERGVVESYSYIPY